MADNIPVSGGGMGQAINRGLTNVFKPINQGLRGMGLDYNPNMNLLFGLNAMRPGIGQMPVNMRPGMIGRPQPAYRNVPSEGIVNQQIPSFNDSQVASAMNRMPDFPMPAPNPLGNQPVRPPVTSQLISRMLGRRANPMGVLEQTRNENFRRPGMRPQTFDPAVEAELSPGDALFGRQVMTPANRTPAQSYNLALIRQLMGK